MNKVAAKTIRHDSQKDFDGLDGPEGWVTTTIGDIVGLNPPKPPQDALPPNAPVTFVPMPAVDAYYGKIAAPNERPFGAVRKGYTAFREDDVIFAKITPCMENGKSAVARTLTNGLGFGSTEFHVLRSNGAVVPDYLFHYLRQESFRRAAEAEMTGSVGQKRVPANFLKNVRLPLPPLSEQKRIVLKVEELLARVNAARERLAKVKEILKHFRQSVLAAAYSGKLKIQKMQFDDNTKKKLKDVVNSIQIGPFGSLLHKADYVASEIPAINPTNFVDGKIKPSQKVTISKSKKRELERYVLKEGDVIVGRRGQMGRCAVVTKEEDGWICGTGALFLRPGAELMPHFLQMLISSPQIVAYLEAASVGSTMTNLNQKIFSTMEIPVPAKEVQDQIVRNGHALFRTSEEIETRCRKAEGFLERLEKEVLVKAFRGELVPTEAELAKREGRPYEPASALLAKIKTQRS